LALNALGLLFQPFFLGAFAAKFPDYAGSAEFAVSARVCTGLAVVKAFLAVAHLHLFTANHCLAVRVITAIHQISNVSSNTLRLYAFQAMIL
jgi:hypothetical protein